MGGSRGGLGGGDSGTGRIGIGEELASGTEGTGVVAGAGWEIEEGGCGGGGISVDGQDDDGRSHDRRWRESGIVKRRVGSVERAARRQCGRWSSGYGWAGGGREMWIDQLGHGDGGRQVRRGHD
eukprot:s290_g17.t1